MLYMLPDQCRQRPCCECHATPAFPYGDAHLDQEDDYLIPHMLVEARQVSWLCLACWAKMVTEDNEPREVHLPYEHTRIRPGLNGLVSEQILQSRPGHLLAGRLVKVCSGFYALSRDANARKMLVDQMYPIAHRRINYRLNHHQYLVPVYPHDEHPSRIRYIPEEFVLID